MTTVCEVTRSVPWWLTFYGTGSVNRRKSVLSLACFTRDTKSVFKRKRSCFVPFSKRFASTHRFRFRPSVLQRRIHFDNAFYTLSAHAQMHSTHAHVNISAREIGAILDSLLLGVVVRFRILWYFPSKQCQEQLQSNQNRKQGAGFERVVLSSLFPKLARPEALKYLVSFLWNLSDASAGLNALELRERQKTGNHSDQERSHMVASARHFGFSRASGLAPGGVYFDDVTFFR